MRVWLLAGCWLVRRSAGFLCGRQHWAILGGHVAVLGEPYEVDKKTRFGLDVKRQCPVLFHRIAVRLDDGSAAEAYAMHDEQVRGKRRLKHGSWRDRFLPRARTAPGPMSEYARKRWE